VTASVCGVCTYRSDRFMVVGRRTNVKWSLGDDPAMFDKHFASGALFRWVPSPCPLSCQQLAPRCPCGTDSSCCLRWCSVWMLSTTSSSLRGRLIGKRLRKLQDPVFTARD